jgi:polyisoprenoid-binding protein YceI
MPRLRSLALAAGLLILAQGPAAAAPTDPAGVQPGTYAIEPTHARVLFAVDHFGVSTWYGDFTHVSGTLTLDPKNPAASLVEVSVPTDSLSTTNATLDGTLKGADWFDVARFPTMTFKSDKVTVPGPGRATIAGQLTLHGVTRPVVLEARFKGAAGPNAIIKSYMIGFDLTGKVKRSDFGISRYLGTISDDVDLIISAPFERKGD